ncbi:sulfurtransferase TusA family protein [Shewanella maritima]|uniref:sulfurtransferase TusA family protein n=1 Tax=Shewanella maritima TaxID=2520507 RepID=UPI003735A28D
MDFIDLTAHRCPYPLVTVKLRLKQMRQGENILVHLSDPGSRQDVPAFVKKMGYEVAITQQNDQLLALLISKS